MKPRSRPCYRRVPVVAGAIVGMLWGGLIALIADQAISNPLADLAVRGTIVIILILLGAGCGWLICFGVDAVKRLCKRR